MSHRIHRNPLPSKVAEHLRQEILDKVWSGRLPGRRVLAKRYKVSEKTCAAAIELLGKEGLLSKGGHGKPWKIKRSPRVASGTMRGKNLLILHDAHSTPSHEDDVLLRAFETIWQDAAGQTFRGVVDYLYYKHPASYLKQLIHRHAVDAIVLFAPPPVWTEVAHQCLPVFQISGQPCKDRATSYFSYYVTPEVERFTRYLAGLGHQRILVPWREANIVPFIAEGLRKGFDGKYSEKQLAPFCPLVENDTPEFWSRFWHQSIASLEPSAVIVFDERHLISLYSFCARAGLKIPRHLSVILMAHNPLFDWVRPKPTMSAFADKTVISHFERWISDGHQPCGVHFLPLVRIDGESVGPANPESATASL